ncbi:MAG: hypothetical protein E7218_02360 [Anaerofustis stercorihominis]|nr:hypothetical protein [Anaerofustis stercorihominis]
MTLYAGWSETPPVLGGGGSGGEIFISAAAVILLIALAALRKKKVSFVSNGGSAVRSVFVKKGSPVNCPEDPGRENYIFEGWYKDSELTTQWNFGSDKVNENMTLYAKWRIKN